MLSSHVQAFGVADELDDAFLTQDGQLDESSTLRNTDDKERMVPLDTFPRLKDSEITGNEISRCDSFIQHSTSDVRSRSDDHLLLIDVPRNVLYRAINYAFRVINQDTITRSRDVIHLTDPHGTKFNDVDFYFDLSEHCSSEEIVDSLVNADCFSL